MKRDPQELIEPQTKLDWALHHAGRGIRVFPVFEPKDGCCTCKHGVRCDHPAKHPRIVGWQSAATPDPMTIRSWWSKWPDANIGGVTGQFGGFVVVDIDPRNQGGESFDRLQLENSKVPEGPVVQTGGGGKHYYFACPSVETKSNSGIFDPEHPGIDFKGGTSRSASFVVLPGSTHANGNGYQWEVGSEFGDVPLPDLPEWILKLAVVKSKATVVKKTDSNKGKILAGNRNSQLTSLAGTMRKRGMSPDSIEAALLVENANKCDPPLAELEVRNIAKSIGNYQPEEASSNTHLELEPELTLDETLTQVVNVLCRYVSFPTELEPVALALWVLHTYCWEQCDCSPYISITSAEKQCGKSRLMEILETLVNRPFRAILPSEAVVYRKVERDRPTMLLDELDAVFGPNASKNYEGLRALLNAGNRAGTTVPRTVKKGNGFDLEEFEVFCPKALAGIGKLPPTIADRSIPIRLRRKKKSEGRIRLRISALKLENERLRLALAQHGARLSELGEVDIPESLSDRAADAWEPLLAIADKSGGRWPERSRTAAIALNGSFGEEDDSTGVLLLKDCKTVFEEHREADLATSTLLDALKAMDESPWSDWKKGGLTARNLADLLRPFGIRSGDLRKADGIEQGKVQKGYRRADFDDPFERYVRSQPATKEVESATALQSSAVESGKLSSTASGCSAVADQKANEAVLRSNLLRQKNPSRGPERQIELEGMDLYRCAREAFC